MARTLLLVLTGCALVGCGNSPVPTAASDSSSSSSSSSAGATTSSSASSSSSGGSGAPQASIEAATQGDAIVALLALPQGGTLIGREGGAIQVWTGTDLVDDDVAPFGAFYVQSFSVSQGRVMGHTSVQSFERTTQGWRLLADLSDQCRARSDVRYSPQGTLHAVCEYYPLNKRQTANGSELVDGAWFMLPGLVWPFADNDTYVASREYGQAVHHFAGGDWTADSAWQEEILPPMPLSVHFTAMTSPAPQQLIISGQAGTLLFMNQRQWLQLDTQTDADLVALDTRNGLTVVVGDGGLVAAFDGQELISWQPVADAIGAVAIQPNGDVYVGGTGGVLWRYTR